MKKLACSFVFYLLTNVFSYHKSIAQTTAEIPKIGYTSLDFILGKMTEAKTISNDLNIMRTQLEKGIEEAVKEFQTKYETYQKNGAQMTDVIRTDKERELGNLQDRIQEMRANAQQSLQSRQEQLLSPVIMKIETAVKAVGKEQGYLYVFSSEGGQQTPFILFAQSEDNDITNLVLQKLGIDPNNTETVNQQDKPTKPTNASGIKPASNAAPKVR